ncbi:VP7 protein [Wanken orbivirus]|nr:VP7 protein [Wanken orbivirus]
MDSSLARAFSILEAAAASVDPYSRVDLSLTDGLAAAINQYNGTTRNPVTMRPVTQEDKDYLFYMCLDAVLGALNIYPGAISNRYTQNVQMAAVLASTVIPFTIKSSNKATRIRAQSETFSNNSRHHHPYVGTVNVSAPGLFIAPVAPANHVLTYTSSNSAEISINAAALAVQLRAHLLPIREPDTVRVYFVWHPIANYGTGAALAQSPPGMTVSVAGIQVPQGTLVTWRARDPVQISNPGAANGMARFEVIWYTTFSRGEYSYDNFLTDVTTVYSYHSPEWHALRIIVLNAKLLEPIAPPIFPPATRDALTTYALLADLADVYGALQPRLGLLNVQLPGPGVVLRDFARQQMSE